MGRAHRPRVPTQVEDAPEVKLEKIEKASLELDGQTMTRGKSNCDTWLCTFGVLQTSKNGGVLINEYSDHALLSCTLETQEKMENVQMKDLTQIWAGREKIGRSIETPWRRQHRRSKRVGSTKMLTTRTMRFWRRKTRCSRRSMAAQENLRWWRLIGF